MTTKINQKGFSLLAAMVAIVSLLLVAGTGYYVYTVRNNDNSDSTKTVENTVSNDKNDTNKSKKDFSPVSYLDVKELSIRVPLSAPIKDVTYQYRPATSQTKTSDGATAAFPATVVFSSKSLSDKSRSCGGPMDGSDTYTFIIVAKTEGQFKRGSYSTSPTSEDVLLKQFKNFSLVTSDDQYAPCAINSNNKAIEQEADNIRAELNTALKQSEEL